MQNKYSATYLTVLIWNRIIHTPLTYVLDIAIKITAF